MTDTPFPDYPGKPRRTPPERACKCNINGREPHPIWAVVHELAHSRVPFTEQWISGQFEWEPDAVEAVCGEAHAEQWIVTARREHPDDTTRAWVGQLTKKR